MIDEWEERRVCPDGACIGVIGGDGRCNICGRTAPNEGGAYRATPAAQVDEDEADDHDDAGAVPPRDEVAPNPAGEGDWGNRTLCSDGTCTGVIGSDGHCKVCGKAAA